MSYDISKSMQNLKNIITSYEEIYLQTVMLNHDYNHQ